MVLKDLAVASVREDAEFRIGEALEQDNGIDGWHHHILIAIGDQHGVA